MQLDELFFKKKSQIVKINYKYYIVSVVKKQLLDFTITVNEARRGY